MLAALAKFTHRFRLLILLAGLAFVAAGVIYGTKVFDHLSQGGFDDTGSDSYQASRIITQRLGQTDASLLVLFSSDEAKVTDPTYKSAVTVALSQVAADPAVRQVTTYYTSDEQSLVSKDQKAPMPSSAWRALNRSNRKRWSASVLSFGATHSKSNWAVRRRLTKN